jgi:DNA-binding NtrC family response regulator
MTWRPTPTRSIARWAGWPVPDLKTTLATAEVAAIREALRATAGNVSQAARDLGMSHRHLYLRMAKLDIDPGEYRGPDYQARVVPRR